MDKVQDYINELIKHGICYQLDNGKIALYHKDIELMARRFHVNIDIQLVSADLKNRCAVVKAIAKDKYGICYTSLGEVHPDNNSFEFFIAVAEKRAVDRAILKAFSLHGDYYSVEELNNVPKESNSAFTPTPNESKIEKIVSLTEDIETKILSQKTLKGFNEMLSKYSNYLDGLLNKDPDKANKLLLAIQEKQQQLKKE